MGFQPMGGPGILPEGSHARLELGLILSLKRDRTPERSMGFQPMSGSGILPDGRCHLFTLQNEQVGTPTGLKGRSTAAQGSALGKSHPEKAP